MAVEVKSNRKAQRALRRLQREHKERVEKLDAIRHKLEQRTGKLQALEARIAEMERRMHEGLIRREPNGPVPAKALRSVRLLFNPKSGFLGKKPELLDRITAALQAHGLRPEIHLKSSGQAARVWARSSVDNQEPLVIVAAGDGTIGDVASQLVGSRTALGILPNGTMNNVARELGIPLDLDQACALLASGITRQVDLGRVRANAKAHGAYFVETAGLGKAIAVAAGQAVRKGRWDKLPRALRKLFNVKSTPVEVQLDDGEWITAESQLVTVSNAPLYGLNYLIAPEAKMDDGWLDVAVYAGMTATDLVAYFRKTANGQRAYHPSVRFYRSRHIVIRTREALPIISDNDEIPEWQSLEIDVVPQAIHVVVGQGSALTLPVQAVASVPPLSGKQTSAPRGTNGDQWAGRAEEAGARPTAEPQQGKTA